MTGYTTLDAYEQFCENSAEYEDYSANPITDSILKHALAYGAGGLGVGAGATGLGMGIKGSLTKKALEEAAAENLLKGGLAGAGLIGAGVIGTKLAKKLLKKKKKKPFNNPSFSEYINYEDYAVPEKSLKGYQKVMGAAASMPFMKGHVKYSPFSGKVRKGQYVYAPGRERDTEAGSGITQMQTPRRSGTQGALKMIAGKNRKIGELENANTQLRGINTELTGQLSKSRQDNAELNDQLEKQAAELGVTVEQLAATKGMIDEATGKMYSPVDVAKFAGRQAAGAGRRLVGTIKGKFNRKKGQ